MTMDIKQPEKTPEEATMLALQEYDEKLNGVASILLDIADQTEDEDLQIKLTALAEQTSPQVKGIDTPQGSRAKIPFLMLMQTTTGHDKVPQGTKPGQMYTTSGMHVGEELEFIPIYLHNIRKKWGDEKIDCQSLDGIMGNKYGACRQCPFGQFAQGVRPECSPGSSVFMVTRDLSHIMHVDFIKTSAQAGRKIKTLALPPALWGRSYFLSVEKQTSTAAGKATYYKYQVRAGEKVPSETQKICDVLFEYFLANHKKAVTLQASFARHLGGNGEDGNGGAAALADGTPETALDAATNTDAIDFSETI